MTTAADAIVPPAPMVHARDLPALRMIVQFNRNTVSTVPNYAFDVMISHRRVLGIDTWLVNDPDGVRHILGSNISNYRKLVALYRVFRPLAGQGVFLAEGDEWRRQRRMLAPLSTPASIGLLLPHFLEAANALVRRLERSATANLSEAFQEATLEAVLRALFSLPDNEQRGRLAAMVRGYLDGLAARISSTGSRARRLRSLLPLGSGDSSRLPGTRRLTPWSLRGGNRRAPLSMVICSTC